MGILDFKEIEDGEEFELFACEFLSLMGLKVIDGPDRGPDGGRDIIAVEKRNGKDFRWLVSCKHNAYAEDGKGRAVKKSDELDIRDRTEFFDCDGFMSFCSTIQSNMLNRYANRFVEKGVLGKYLGMHKGIIESVLLHEKDEKLAKRYFKDSYNTWVRNGRVASSTYEIRNSILQITDNHKDIIIGNLLMISNAKTLLMGNVPIDINDIDELQRLISKAFDLITFQENEGYFFEDIDDIFKKADVINEKITNTIHQHFYGK